MHQYNLRPRNVQKTVNNSNKRKRDESEEVDEEYQIPSKKIKIDEYTVQCNKFNKYRKINTDVQIPENKDWISATSIRNYLQNDPIVDWLEMYYGRLGFNEDVETDANMNKQVNNFTINNQKPDTGMMFRFEMGNKFENEVMKEIRNKIGNTKRVCFNKNDMANRNLHNKTLEHMKNGVPVIEQAMLINPLNKTYGVADLIIRSDYINKLFATQSIDNQDVKAPLLNGNYHYLVVDIKWSQIPLTTNKINVLNVNRFPSNKGQLAIYNFALGYMQGYVPKYSFILGKGWSHKMYNKEYRGYDCFDRAGIIDFFEKDIKILTLTADAIEWIRDLRINGHKWSCLKPERKEMYPNMCVNDIKWQPVKEIISKKIYELTSLWMVSYKNRLYAHNNNIFSWNDENCTSESLNIKGKIVAPVLDEILNINRSEECIIKPEYIQNNINNWKNKTDHDFYFDIETVNEVNVNTHININNSKKLSGIIFMIGVGYEENGDFKYHRFVIKECNLNEEKRILSEFFTFINNKIKERNGDTENVPRLYHWYNAEEQFLKNANIRHNNYFSQQLDSIQLIDLHEIFRSEPIVVKGMFNFSLKNVANAMYEQNLINTRWNTNINDGNVAMSCAEKYFRNVQEKRFNSEQIMNDVTEYNKIDCKVLWEITNYLRDYHC